MKYSKMISLFAIIIISMSLLIIACDNRVIEPPSYTIQDIFVNPDLIYADNNDATYAEIKVKIVDVNDSPVEGETVNFSCSNGYINGSAETNSQGLAIVNYYDIGEITTSIITASYNGESMTAQVSVVASPSYHIVQMEANPDTIYSDNNITYSEIAVKVQNDEGFAVTNETVSFRSDIGNLIYQVQTDSSGIAQTTFWDSGDIGIATIEAFVADAVESVTVTIEESPEIETLNLNFDSSEILIDETTLVRASCQSTAGDIPDGSLILFETDLGYFESLTGIDLGTATQVSTSNSQANVTFNAGTLRGVANITCTIGGVITSDQLTIRPGSPKYMFLEPETDHIQANSNEEVVIQAQVEDRYHNPVSSGVGVSFSTDLGTVIEFDNTDADGLAQTIFSPGITSGSALIEAVADSAQASTVISVTSDEIYSLEFAFPGKVDIHVQGTGGQESYEFQVNLYDVSGNLIDDPEPVWFQFMNGPDGININDTVIMPHGGNDPDSLSVISSNGHAIVSVSSGINSGPAALKAYVYRTEVVNGDTIQVSAIKSNIVVHSGPPNSVDIYIGDNGQGEPVGVGIWRVECAALLTDEHGNPVDYGTAVWFSIPDDPEWATIETDVYVGNENANGDSLDGIAFTFLEYHGSHTNEDLTVQVEVPSTIPGQNFLASGDITMPIQEPTIEVICIPEHVDWTEDYNPEWQADTFALSPKVQVIVRDGQQNLIKDQEVIFTSTLGLPVYENQLTMTPTNPAFEPDIIDYTGPDNDNEPLSEENVNNGEIIQLFRFYKYECPVPPVPSTIQVQITATLPGIGVSGSAQLNLIRYVE